MSKEGKPQKPEIKSVSAVLHKAGVDSVLAIEYDQMYGRLQVHLNSTRKVKELSEEAFKLGFGAERIDEPNATVIADLIKRCVELNEVVTRFEGEAARLKNISRQNVNAHVRNVVRTHQEFLKKAEMVSSGHGLIIERLAAWIKDHKKS